MTGSSSRGRAEILLEFGRHLAQGWIVSRAAQMAFFFALSAFPMLMLLMAAVGHFPDAQNVMRETIAQHLATLVPPSMLRLISDLLDHLAERPTGLLTGGGVVAIWAASSGMVATVDGLNQAYDISAKRLWWKRRLVGIGLTGVIICLIIIATALLSVGAPLAQTLAERSGLGSNAVLVWRLAKWPAVLCLTLLAFDLLYHFGPHRGRPSWRWFPLESLVAITLWIAGSVALKAYLTRFGNFSVLYGAVGGVIVLLLWLYLTAVAILFGAHVATQLRNRPRIQAAP